MTIQPILDKAIRYKHRPDGMVEIAVFQPCFYGPLHFHHIFNAEVAPETAEEMADGLAVCARRARDAADPADAWIAPSPLVGARAAFCMTLLRVAAWAAPKTHPFGRALLTELRGAQTGLVRRMRRGGWKVEESAR